MKPEEIIINSLSVMLTSALVSLVINKIREEKKWGLFYSCCDFSRIILCCLWNFSFPLPKYSKTIRILEKMVLPSNGSSRRVLVGMQKRTLPAYHSLTML
ncbi:hypothetical protein VZ94_20105 [Methylocucumis oryzae]|uniref:Uncharacterized protein n=1 Tax=Methylocucumis oryzae TaxID=1632867 RepID=A0A0F3IEK1_9GAMM|nr:hypothetical protein VZ94_20105 [Methylocucumis oryzae]